MTEMHERIRLARESAGYASAADAARSLGLKEARYRHHENGRNAPRHAELELYARRYRVSVSWLLTGRGDMKSKAGAELVPGPVETAPILGRVRAGAFDNPPLPALSEPEAGFEHMPIPPGYSHWKHRYILRVEGHSMNEIAPAGSFVLCLPTVLNGIDPFSLALERQTVVVVQRRDPDFDDRYEYTLKQLVFENDRWVLRPRTDKTDLKKDIILPPLDYDAEPSNGQDDIAIIAVVKHAWIPL